MNAGRELDALIAEKVMGWTVYRWNSEGGYDAWLKGFRAADAHAIFLSNSNTLSCFSHVDNNDRLQIKEWHPSTDIAAAWDVVKHLQRPFSLERWSDGRWQASFASKIARGMWPVAETSELAICRAALRWLGVEA